MEDKHSDKGQVNASVVIRLDRVLSQKCAQYGRGREKSSVFSVCVSLLPRQSKGKSIALECTVNFSSNFCTTTIFTTSPTQNVKQ